MRRLLKSRELAEVFGLTDNTLRIWRMNADGPPFYKLGKAVRYDERKVREWLKEREREAQ
jgi:predicted DNA-binding transcriptional regulator AlpA